MEELREGQTLVTLFFYRSGIASVGVAIDLKDDLPGLQEEGL